MSISESQQNRFSDQLEQLNKHIQQARIGSISTHGQFRCCVKAAISKAYEFAVAMQKKGQQSFFSTATLRGICEDLIVLSFLETLSDRDELIVLKTLLDVEEGLSRQKVFFEENSRRWQPISPPSTKNIETAKEHLIHFGKKYNWKVKKHNYFPSVFKMAEMTNNKSFYNFMYHATSQWVHYSPTILLRMGWGTKFCKREEFGPNSEIEFTTENFSEYYDDFNSLYSVLLLVLHLKKFCGEFHSQDKVLRIAEMMDEELAEHLRWPEIVTHEEMNVKPPSGAFRVFMKIASKIAPSEPSHKEGQNKDDLGCDAK